MFLSLNCSIMTPKEQDRRLRHYLRHELEYASFSALEHLVDLICDSDRPHAFTRSFIDHEARVGYFKDDAYCRRFYEGHQCEIEDYLAELNATNGIEASPTDGDPADRLRSALVEMCQHILTDAGPGD